MVNKQVHAIFNYCTFWDFEQLEAAAKAKNHRSRVCYVTTQACRLYLNLSVETLQYTAYVKGENCWEQVQLLPELSTVPMALLLRSPGTLRDGMTQAFFKQFPEAEVSFYKVLPSSEEVLATLATNPRVATLEENFYIFSRDEETTVDDATGVVTIVVDEGELMIPYDSDGVGASYKMILQLYRAKLHPDNKIAYKVNRIMSKIEDIWMSIRSHGWSDFRRLVDHNS